MTPARRIVALVLMTGVFVMEGYDINAMGLAVPRLKEALGLDPTGFGIVFSAMLVGIGVGGAFIAPFGDRVGRRTLIVLGCLATGVFTFATATATTVTEFFVWRALTGISLGAALPNVSALSSELAPEKLRSTFMAIVSAGIPLGLALAGLTAPEVIRAGGWHGMFVVPGAMAVLLAGVLFVTLEGGLPASTTTGKASRTPQLDLFRNPWALPFAVFATLLMLNATNLYLLNSWLPTVLPLAGFTLDLGARITGIVQFAGLAVGVVASLMVDRWRPAPTLMLMFGAMAASLLAVALSAPDATRWTLLLSIGVGGASAGGMVLPALCAHLFPAGQLSSAIGMGVLVGRIGAFAGPLVGQAILASGAGAQMFFLAAAVCPALCVLAAFAVPVALRVKQREATEALG